MASKKKRAKAKSTARKPVKKAASKPARRAPKRAAKARPKPAAAAAPGASKATPYLCVKGGLAALDFYTAAFGAIETLRIVDKSGRLGHADIEIEGATIMLSDEWPEGGVFSPQTLGGSPVSVHLYVKNVDALTRRALAAGATEVRPVADQPYGDRSGTIRDPFGHRWMLSTKQEDVSKDEMERRFGGAFLVS
ncbi:MAG TPA: VOC family protein [Myxococcota bacterium]|nr:VOC family protein [Myxococcota bacterium]